MVKASKNSHINPIPDTRDCRSKVFRAREDGLVAGLAESHAVDATVNATSALLVAGKTSLEHGRLEFGKPSDEQERAWEVERVLRDERAKVQRLKDELFAAKSRHTQLEAELKQAQDRIDAFDPKSTVIRPKHQVTIDALGVKIAVVTKQIREANSNLASFEYQRKGVQAQLTVLQKERAIILQENEDLEKEIADLSLIAAVGETESETLHEPLGEPMPEIEPVGKKAKAAAKKELAAYLALERKAASLKGLEDEVKALECLIEATLRAKDQIPIVKAQLEREEQELARLNKFASEQPQTPPDTPSEIDQEQFIRKLQALGAQVAELEGEKLRGEWSAAQDDSAISSYIESRPVPSSGGSESGQHECALDQLVATIRALSKSSNALRSENTTLLLQLAQVEA